jgi:hypothetical protein
MERALSPFLIAPFVYYLLMSNSISPACQNDVTTALEIGFGTVAFLGSLALGVIHHRNNQGVTDVPTTPMMKKFIEAMRNFAVKKPQEPPQI